VVANIGSAEIPTDPMPVEIADYVLVMKPKSEWTSASTKQGMFNKLEEALHSVPGVGFEFSQPIQQIMVTYDYQRMAQYGLHIQEVNQVIRSAFAGEKAGIICQEKIRIGGL